MVKLIKESTNSTINDIIKDLEFVKDQAQDIVDMLDDEVFDILKNTDYESSKKKIDVIETKAAKLRQLIRDAKNITIDVTE